MSWGLLYIYDILESFKGHFKIFNRLINHNLHSCAEFKAGSAGIKNKLKKFCNYLISFIEDKLCYSGKRKSYEEILKEFDNKKLFYALIRAAMYCLSNKPGNADLKIGDSEILNYSLVAKIRKDLIFYRFTK